MRTAIRIEGLQTYGYHGLFEEERRLGQKFSFDVYAELDDASSHSADDLSGSLRYDAVVDAVVVIANAAKYQTLEALGEAIACGLIRQFALIQRVRVGASKYSPPIPHALVRVGVEVELTRAELDASLARAYAPSSHEPDGSPARSSCAEMSRSRLAFGP